MKKDIKDYIINFIKNSFITLGLVFVATLLGCIFANLGIQETNIVVTYLLSVLLVARFTNGYLHGILATISSILLFNWFFTEPIYTLKVNDPTYSITFIIMSVTAIVTSALTTKVKQAAAESRLKEKESNALYRMTNYLTDAEDRNSIGSITVKTISQILSCNAAIICYDEDGNLEKTFIQQKGDKQIRRELIGGEELKNRVEILHKPYDEDKEYYNYPVYGRTMNLAILRIPKETASQLDSNQLRMLHAVIESTALALERLLSLRAQAKSQEEATQEHYRGNLLRSISHDIRTPLSGIMGNAEMLMGMTDKEDPKYEIESGIYQDADWLHSLVENILNLTKLHDGRLVISKQYEAIEEVVGSALRVIEKRCPKRNIDVNMPEELIMAPMEAKLINQVIVNLIDNAIKHTDNDKEILVSIKKTEKFVEISVADRGCGISEGDLPSVFQMFYTTRRKCPDSQRGIGLGLAICQSIVEAHGGTISVSNRDGGGAEFIFTLPLEE